MSLLPTAAETELLTSVEDAVKSRPQMRPLARRYMAYEKLYARFGLLPVETLRTLKLAMDNLPEHLRNSWNDLVSAYEHAYDESRAVDD